MEKLFTSNINNINKCQMNINNIAKKLLNNLNFTKTTRHNYSISIYNHINTKSKGNLFSSIIKTNSKKFSTNTTTTTNNNNISESQDSNKPDIETKIEKFEVSLVENYISSSVKEIFLYLQKNHFLHSKLSQDSMNMSIKFSEAVSLKDKKDDTSLTEEEKTIISNEYLLKNEVERLNKQLHNLSDDNNCYYEILGYFKEILSAEDLIKEAKEIGEESLVESTMKEIDQMIKQVNRICEEVIENFVEEDTVRCLLILFYI